MKYITREELAEMIKNEKVVVVYNVPLRTAEFRMGVYDLVQKTAAVEVMVFHCALSQMRGPKAARIYEETRSNLKVGADKPQEVYVLRDGFNEFQRKFKDDPALVENWEAEDQEEIKKNVPIAQFPAYMGSKDRMSLCGEMSRKSRTNGHPTDKTDADATSDSAEKAVASAGDLSDVSCRLNANFRGGDICWIIHKSRDWLGVRHGSGKAGSDANHRLTDRGLIGGVLSLASFQNYFGLDKMNAREKAALEGNIVAILQVGCLLGALGVGSFSGRFGRIIYVVGSALQVIVGLGRTREHALGFLYFGRPFTLEKITGENYGDLRYIFPSSFLVGQIVRSPQYATLVHSYSTSFLGGIGVGMVTALVPSYVSECTPRAIRGRCTGLIQLANNIGIMLSSRPVSTHLYQVWVNYTASKHISPNEKQWRIPFAIQIVPGILFLLLVPFQPESPRYMVEHEQYDRAAQTLAFLACTTPDDTVIFEAIEEIKIDFVGKRKLSIFQQITRMGESRGVSLRCFIPSLVMFFQQWTGTNAINYFSPQIFASLGVHGTTAKLFATGIYGIVKVVTVSFVLAFAVEGLGRKNCLIIGGLGQGTMMFWIGVYSGLHPPATSMPPPPWNYVSIVAVYLYAAFFSIGWGPLPWVVASEVAPNHLRTAVMSIATGFNWLLSLTISKLTPIMLNELKYGTFLLFGFCCFGMAFWAWLCLPETAGFTLEEIGLLFEKDVILRALQDAPGGRFFIGNMRAAPVGKLNFVSVAITAADFQEAAEPRESEADDLEAQVDSKDIRKVFKLTFIGSVGSTSIYAYILQARSNASVNKDKVGRVPRFVFLFPLKSWLQGLSLRSAKFGDHDGVRFDAVICANKAILDATPSMEDMLRPVIGPDAVIVLIQNGVGQEEALHKGFPTTTIIASAGWTGARTLDVGVVQLFTRSDTLFLGVDWDDNIPRTRQQKHLDIFIDILVKSNARITVKEDIQVDRWVKVIWWGLDWHGFVYVLMNIITGTLLGPDNKGAGTQLRTSDFISTSPHATSLARLIIVEGINVAKAKGLPIPEDTLDTMMAKYTTLTGSDSSMLVDAINMKPMEVESIVGHPMREGLRLGVPVPTLTTIYALLKAMDWKHAYPDEARLDLERANFQLAFWAPRWPMMTTRRKSKAAAVVTADPENEATSAAADNSQRLTVFIPSDIDLDTLSNLLPETSITSPNPESIIDLYRRLIDLATKFDATVRERDEDRAEAEKMAVELDQALQDREAMSRDLEGSAENLQAELKQVKQERDQLLSSQAALQAQIFALSTSQSSSSTEVDNLKHRVEDTEREKRDLVGVISRLKQDSSQREEEIQTLRANLKEARHEHQALETQVRELRSTETSTKFKLESLTQQLQLSQSEAERTNTELIAKSEEYSKHRRAKHAELVTLQANFDALTQTHASTQATLKSIQSAHTAQTHQLTQALSRVQDLTGQLAEQEATYSSEASGLRRLVGMMEERESKAKEIVETIEREWAGVGEKAERREAALRDEVESERRAREEAEKRTEQLEEVLERMGRGDLPVPGPRALDAAVDGMMGISPTVAMVSKAQRSGKTFTEVYADYVRLQEEFVKKCTEYDRMDQTLTAVLSQIEERAPILSQQRTEYERLQSEASHLGSQLAQAISDRDSQATFAQENSQKLSRSTRENELLQQQLTDLGRQIQNLLREIGRRDDPSIPSDADIEMIAAAPAETIDGVITNNLVLFQSIGQLQEQNQKLLKIVRELGDKMEGEERDYREAMEREQGEAVREAHEAMQELADQLERQKSSSDTIIKAYMKERDALKAMLARVEKDGVATNGMRTDVNGFGEGLPPNTSDMAKELVEMQNQFETYRTEMGVDSVRLREEVVLAQREAGQLGAALAKANARIEYLSGVLDRHRMSQEQFSMHGREIEDLTKRNQQLFDQWTRIDIECSRATEDLQTANGRIEQLRNECANLRAEKKIWESVQGRLVEENKTLAMERSHLSDLMGNVQKMHNDLEKSGENDRRRLENQLQMLEGQTQDLRLQLSQERDSVRHISLQKDIELKERQTQIDKNVQELSKTREALIGAQTSKTHLEQRVEELTRELQGDREKLAVYERRSSVGGITHHMDQDLNREQQLEAEVAELRSHLKVTEVDLATARSHVDQFREISQANEIALKSLDATYDEYKTSTEAQIARHESEYSAIQEKLNAAQQELAQYSVKYNELQKSFETERTAWTNDKRVLEDTIVDLGTTEKYSESDRTTRENEVRQQEERAKAAEERYNQVVVAHAESIQSVATLKKQLSTIQARARDYQTGAETATAKLTTSESSWALQKDALDKEVSDLNRRCQDLTSQNSILHQHLESVTSQAARIKQAAESSTAPFGEGEPSDDTDIKLTELRSVVAYLRKEKEIVDLQLELSKQENARLKTQIEHLSQTLNDTRATLSDERERAVENAASAAQHAELVERINQLNILRESNATLRTESETHAKRSRELEVKLKRLSAQLDPAKEQARVAQAELEARSAQLARLEEENRKWQERNTQLLSKYDRIDPADVQSLKDEIEQLKAQAADAETAKAEQEKVFQAQQERTEAVEKNLRTYKDSYAKNNESFRARLGQMNTEKSAMTAEKQQLLAKVAALEAEMKTLQESKASSDAEKATSTQTSSAEMSAQAAALTALRAERDALLAEKSTWIASASMAIPAPADVEEAKRVWEAEKAELVQARDIAQAEVKDAEKKLADSKTSQDKLTNKARELMKAQQKAGEVQRAAVDAAVAKALSEVQGPSAEASSDDIVKKHAEELQALRETLSAKHATELKAAVDAARAENPGSSPAVDVDAMIAAAIAKHDKDQEKGRQDEITAAVERGRAEAAARAKLKDQQLVKTQKKVKDLETQILSWQKEGILPPPTTTPSASASVASASAAAPASTSAPDSTPVAKPATAARTGAPAAAARGAAPGGVARGGAAPRGAATRGRGNAVGARGGAARIPPVAPTTAPAPATGVSIMGAAKRPREEDSAGEDSLAKRLKPAEAGGSKPPVQLRRPPPP
ncbi:hypothetical protein DFH07DRAFT_772602 [Mycena maculata]|uniref:Major facilitator superfamily (MFS) profile domain-containing protein n=1 Tax=Mycena maculata TaxID=230809 RepID=A0AAD7J816_9AGAR|nr:hypothetical protein DFH07DRAFT_772602 [Mycena maculata]